MAENAGRMGNLSWGRGKAVFPVLVLALASKAPSADLLSLPEKPADPALGAFSRAIEALHERAVRSRTPWTEEDLQKKVPRAYLELEKRYLAIRDEKKRADLLSELALAYAELAWADRIRPLAAAVEELDPERAAALGHFDASEHFLVRVVGAGEKWCRSALRLAEAAHAGYLERFGFAAISKVPGKKIRILIRVDPDLDVRLYFHPSPPYHSELRYEIPDATYLTLAGKQRIVYGFCHELGHMVAMWGDRRVEDDKHAWAHYTGSLIVEEVYDRLDEPWPGWTPYQRRASGLQRLLGQVKDEKPGLESYGAILALFHAVGEEFGAEIYGRCWSWLEREKRFRRVQRVPYLWLKDLREALEHAVPPEKRPRIAEIFGGRRR